MKGVDDDKNIEEDWPLKDVVFVEDQKSLPIGIFIQTPIVLNFTYYNCVFSRPCCSCRRFVRCS